AVAAQPHPAGERHYTIRANLTAAFNDGQITAKRLVAPRYFRLKRLVGIQLQTGHAVVPRLQLSDQLRQLPVTCRAAHEAYPRGAFKDALAFLLRHAAEHADNFPFTLLGAVFSQS